MKDLVTLLQTYDTGTIIIFLALLLMAFFGVAEAKNKIKGYFDVYYNKRNSSDKRDQEIDDRLEKLENASKSDEERFNDLSRSIGDIKVIIEKIQDSQNRSNMATARSAMYRIANELLSKQWMSQTEYDTLSELSSVYSDAGGTISKHSLIERALSLPVLTDEEIQKKKFNERK